MYPIYTIGYGNRPIIEFTKLLQKYSIEYVIDVRSQPYSPHNPIFSQSQLKPALLESNVKYLFLGDQLGGKPDDPECYLPDGRVDYDLLSAKSFYTSGLARIANASKSGYRVTLMCSELRPHECHRSKLIGRSLSDMGIEVHHIDEKGEILSQEEVIRRFLASIGAHNPIQLSLFEPPNAGSDSVFTSRNSYRKQANEIE